MAAAMGGNDPTGIDPAAVDSTAVDVNVNVDDRLAGAILRPASVALVGISDDRSKTSARPLQYLRQAGYAGRVYPINPRRDTVQGERAWPSLAALPEVPEHVFVLSPTETVLDVARECARLGVAVLTVLASGFSEAGAQGAEREAALRDIARASGLRIIGPSSLGVVRPATGLALTANAAFAEPDLPAGKTLVASQSGSMIGALVSRGKARGVGFAGLVSVGNETDLSIGEICAATLNDPDIDGYLLFMESMRHGAQLRRFAIEAARRGKPVIVYKLGRSAAAAEMAMTHTGALAGEDQVADAFFRDMGIARVGVLEALLETHPLAKRVALDRPVGRVGVVTTTGGGAAMAVDQLGIRNVDVVPPSPATLAALERAGLPCAPGRVLDLTLAGTRYEVMKPALEILLDAPEFDLILAVTGSSARFQPELLVKPIIECAGHPRPLATMVVPDAPKTLAMLTEAGVPCFRTPEACGDAIAAVFNRRPPKAIAPKLPAAALTAPRRPLSEAGAYRVLADLGIAHAPWVLIDGAGAPASLPFGFPVVAKVCSPDIGHKTEIGGVQVGIGDAAALATALGELRANAGRNRPDARLEGILVQPMCKALGEVLIGYRIDPQAGPIIMLAPGGVLAELSDDRSIRLAPVDVDEAAAMIGEVRALRALQGFRNKARGDLAALARAISALSQLAVRAESGVVEAEINPLFVLPEGEGVMAVDALVYRLSADRQPAT